jgi:hypothetical protein
MDRAVSENTTGLFAVDRRRRRFGALPARSGLHPSVPVVKASIELAHPARRRIIPSLGSSHPLRRQFIDIIQ